MLITGSFREYPFPLLLDIFLRRGETGLLEVSSTEESGYFYLKNGKVKDGQVGKKRGTAAVALVGKLNDASFQFKPLAPSDYARVVWQRRFGPTETANYEAPISVAATRNAIGQFVSRAAAAHQILKALAYSTQRAARELRRLRQEVSARQDKRRRDRHLTARYPRRVAFQLPSPTLPDRAAVRSAFKEGVETVVFVFILTLLLGFGGLMLHQLVSEDDDVRGAGVDEHFDYPVNANQSRAKTKQHGNRRLPGGAWKDR